MDQKKICVRKEVGYFDGLLIFLFAIVANLVMQLVLSVVGLGVVSATGREITQSDYFQLVAMLLLQVAFLSVPVLYYACKKKARPLLAAPLCKPVPGLALSVLLPVLTMVGFSMPAMFFGKFLDKIGYALSAGVGMDTPGKLILGIIAVVIVAPVVEEIIFRGFLLSGLRKQFGPIVSAVMCGAAFALMHMSPEQTIYQFFLGFVCSLAAVYGKNLLACIITHAGSNLLALFAGGLSEKATAWLLARPVAAVFVILGLMAACGACISAVLFGLYKFRRKEQPLAAPTAAVDPFDASVPTEDAAKESSAPERPGVSKTERMVGMGIYCGGVGLCLLIWIFVFAAALL